MTDKPILSVIILLGGRRERAEKALRSVLDQDAVSRLEVLLVDTAAAANPPLPGSDHPSARIIPLPGEALFSEARARGVELACGEIVAFLEEHAWALPGWASALIAAFEGPWAGVGGEVHNGNPSSAGSRGFALMNYHPWLPPARAGEATMLVGHNSAYRRRILVSYGAALQQLLRSELTLFTRLLADGHQLYVDPAVRFAHMNATTILSASRASFFWNRAYAPNRAEVLGWSRARRLFYIAASPLMPFHFVVKLAASLRRRRPDLLPLLVPNLPRILLTQTAAALGYVTGLVFGAGEAEASFTCYEMNEYRPPG